MTAGGPCRNGSVPDGSARNSTPGDDAVLLEPCTDDSADAFTFRSTSNRMDVRVRAGRDHPQKGFCASYVAVAGDQALTEDCPYGWVSGQKFCYRVYGRRLAWMEAEDFCRYRGGHLASVTDNRIAVLLDDIITNSLLYNSNNAFWIGANDLRYENCYEWIDGQVFDFFSWFPGWKNHGWYSVQPSDDGLSQQNCVELRNLFRYPSKGEGKTDRFYWNDRDCRVANPFVCQRLKPGANLESLSIPACNRTIVLSLEHPRDVVTSPGFPNNYPNNIECHYYVTAIQGQRIVALFSDFSLEESDSCEYDVVTLREEDIVMWRRCGDWESKIKLLRHTTRGSTTLQLIFSSDFSNSYKGFRTELSLFTERSEQSVLCDNDMFQLRDNNCYLVVNYPETSWSTARQICSEAKAKLAVVENAKQVSVLDQLVRDTYGYMSGSIYWVGAFATAGNSTWRWLDGSLLNPNHSLFPEMRIFRSEDSHSPSCLAIQWRQFRNSNTLRWTAKDCNHSGRFICKKPSVAIPEQLNKTMNQLTGNLTSVNYPSNYLNDLDYIIEIIGPPSSRVVITFHHFDLEWQEDCLYDFVLLRSSLSDDGVRLCGEHKDKEYVAVQNKAYLSFHSDFSITSPGFAASWEIVDISVCLNRRLLILEPIHVTSLRYPRPYLSGIECRVTVTASQATQRLLITIVDFDLGPCMDDFMEVNLDPTGGKKSARLCGNHLVPGTQLMAFGNEMELIFHSGAENEKKSTNRGYNITCEAWEDSPLETTLFLTTNRAKGRIHSLNFNQQQPVGLNYSQRLVVPLGHKIHLHAPNMSLTTPLLSTRCDGSGLIVRDRYALHKTLAFWSPCRSSSIDETNGLWSTLNVLSIHSWNFDGSLPVFSFDYAVVKDDHFVNTTIAILSDSVESCHPNPCQHGGRCMRNGTDYRCHCFGHYTGLFCHLTWCDIKECGGNGYCNLTANSWTCECLPGFTGAMCDQSITPCSPDPCEPNGVCTYHNGTVFCICDTDFEGALCEKFVIHIPYKPLSQRMLEEPFWLGLITVFTVLVIILFVYCIKRKFADKIEKFLAEEIERKPSPPATRYSLSSTQPSLTPGNQSPQTCPKSLFNRIRKNSILSTTCSPSPTADREQPRTFSFDDILRRVHSSKRQSNKGSNNAAIGGPSTSNAGNSDSREEAAKKEEEKSRILASLVTSNKESVSRRVSLDEFFRMSERKLQLSARRTLSSADSTEGEGAKKETSFISIASPKTLRQSFSEIQCIRENSIEYISSSESLNGEPSTSEVQVDISPQPFCEAEDQIENEEENVSNKSPENPRSQAGTPSPTPSEHSIPAPVSIVIDPCDSEGKQESETDDKNCDSEPKDSDCEKARPVTPTISRNSSYLEVPHPIPSIHVFAADADTPPSETTSSPPKEEKREQSSPCKPDFVQPRKYSVDLPMPKILITANMGACDSDEASPPRTPNPNKSMMYLSPLAVISTDRTISESNLSTSGYSSISSPGLSRCNSSSPISDDVEHHHSTTCNRKTDAQSPKKPHGLQMTYLSVGGSEKTFIFPPTIACHCHEVTPNQSSPVVFDSKSSPAVSSVWRQSPGKQRILYKRNSYQTTSTDDSIDDEGIGLDTIDFKIRKGEVRSARDLEMYIATEKGDTTDWPGEVTATPLLLEPVKPEIGKPPNGNAFKGSPRPGLRKGEKTKKHGDKHRRSPVMSPATTPVKDHEEVAEVRIPRNSSRSSMSGLLVSSSESDETEGYVGTRQKSQARRSKKQQQQQQLPHEAAVVGHKPPMVSMPSQDSSGPVTDKSSDTTGRSSPVSESNGDSAPMDSRSPASSSSESLPSTRDPAVSKSEKASVATICNRHKLALEHACSFPPPSHQCSRHSGKEDDKASQLKSPQSKSEPPNKKCSKKLQPPLIQLDPEEELRGARSFDETLHPCLRRQEAIVEDDPSDDSSSETTVLLRRPAGSEGPSSGRGSPRSSLQQSSSADISEWEAFHHDNKE